MVKEPCLCGDPLCPSCGPLMGTNNADEAISNLLDKLHTLFLEESLTPAEWNVFLTFGWTAVLTHRGLAEENMPENGAIDPLSLN